MKHIDKFGSPKVQPQLIKENTSETFYIDKKTKELIPDDGEYNSSEYWVPGRKRFGTVDLEIEVFAFRDHEHHAKLLYDALVSAGIQDKYTKLEVDVK